MQQENKIDENLYSRQIAVYGAETQGKLVKMKCFIYGLRGLGVEIAKNLVLAGPSAVTIYDPEVVSVSDLSSNFYCTIEDIGKRTRAEASIPQLKELNPYVTVSLYSGNPTPEALSVFDVVIMTDLWDVQYLKDVNAAVRAKGHGFIYSHVSGLNGSTFVDFGDKFQVFDPNGEDPKSAIVSGITQDKDGLVTVHDDKRHGFQDGDTITFREVLGMTEVNDQKFKIKVNSPFTFQIGDTSNFHPYQREGVCEQVKEPQPVVFRSFASSLTHPCPPDRQDLDLCDWEKIGRPEQLHVVFNALLEFAKTHDKQLPRLNDEADAQEVFELAKKINESDRGEGAVKVDLNEEIVKNCARFARAQITPLVSFWGGIAAQEAVKFTGKFSPLRQWLHSEFFEALPDHPVNRELGNSRYDDFVAIFGQETLRKVHELNVFMIGAGALGCEYVKMFSLMGLGSEGKGQVTITDDDNIEISNLNRQFLFRKDNVGHNKAFVACEAGKRMNKKVNYESKALRVGEDNEKIFNDDFWERMDIAVNAVDNIHARRYIDDKCCYYLKPMFESGTLGTKCNSQLILPKSTQSYSETQDPPEESIPLCTLKNFPNQIEHTIQWARDYFEGVFADGSIECIKYLENPSAYIHKTTVELKSKPGVLRPRLETIKKYIEAFKVRSYEKCVELARNMFQDAFYNKIHELLFCFPLDHRTSEGQLFWTNPKRPPTPIQFDAKDETHLLFVQSAANIFANIFGLPYELNKEKVRVMADKANIEKFQPRKVQLKENDKDTKEEKAEDDEEIINTLKDELATLSLEHKEKLNECVFEKDDPTNWHIDFVAAVSNLRARNYKIAEVSPFKVKLIAGKIIPALATTTAMIVGAVGMEIIKYLLNKDVTKMRNAFMNLALPLFLFSEPLPPSQHKDQENSIIFYGPVKAVPPNWTAWDRIVVDGPMTLQQFIEYFDKNYNVEVTSITCGKYLLFSNYPPPKKEFLSLDVADAYRSKFGQIPDYRKFLDLLIGGDFKVPAGQELPNADLAPIKYRFKK